MQCVGITQSNFRNLLRPNFPFFLSATKRQYIYPFVIFKNNKNLNDILADVIYGKINFASCILSWPLFPCIIIKKRLSSKADHVSGLIFLYLMVWLCFCSSILLLRINSCNNVKEESPLTLYFLREA